MKQSKISLESLRRVLSYDAEAGVFTWKVSTSNRAPIGSVAGAISGQGHRYISVFGENVSAHRLAWFYTHGEWPVGNIVPINGKRDDIRLVNLKAETAAETARKSEARATSRSGVKGVCWQQDKQKWIATITRNYKRVHLGYFNNLEDASAAYQAAVHELPDKGKVELDAETISKRRQLRVLWNKLLSTGSSWKSFDLFIEDVKEVPSGCDFMAIDASQPIGPGNFQFIKRVVPTSAMWIKKFRENNVEYCREVALKKNFGINLDDYNKMHEVQGGVCAICGQPETQMRGGKVKWLAVDHNHKTGSIRELLCHDCNTGMGKLKEDPVIINSVLRYLEKHKE